MRGPVPNRSNMRRHRMKVDITHVPAEDKVSVPKPDPDWHPIAHNWYVALSRSGQRVFFENSDWAHAVYIAEAMSRSLEAKQMSSTMFAAILAGAAELLTTEGARRRMRVELERAAVEGETTASEAMAAYKKMASTSAAGRANPVKVA